MKIRTILVSMLAIAVLAGCSDNGDPVDPGTGDTDVAYLSIRIKTQEKSRSSGENDGENESDIQSLYLVTFNSSGNVIGVPGTTNYYVTVSPASESPAPVKVSGEATGLLVIANPGDKLMAVLNSINATSNLASINLAISDATKDDITDDVDNITKGFAMINCGDEGTLGVGDKITDPLIDITGKVKKVADEGSEQEAKDAADEDRVTVNIERLASKIDFALRGGTIPDIGTPTGASFAFVNWTLDAVNSTFYPFAEKSLIAVAHTGTFYGFNFYTHDPNFADNTGILYVTIGADYAPVLHDIYGWMNATDQTYCIENTMDAAEQTFENATRIVVKGIYTPAGEGFTAGEDWFNFAGINYNSLASLKEAYTAAGTGSNLANACDAMFGKIKEYADASEGTIVLTGDDFGSLTTADLDAIPNGGELIKDGKNPVIRWYQKGLNYYYYEIRHDNETTVEMAFGKYGVVRNNWYSLTLNTVSGAGTPWYPDINNPGPGDPDPTDPIDQAAGYLGITIETAPWVIWNNGINL